METSNITNALLHKSFIAIFFCTLITILFVCPRAQGESVVWTNTVSATPNGNTLTKTSGCGDCAYDAGGISQQQIDSAGGYVEFSPSYGKRLFAGLGNDLSSTTDYNNINYAFNFWGGGGGDWDIREGWANYRASGTFVAGDVFRISVENGVVKYYKNGQLVYTSQVTPTYPLVLDTCLVSLNAAVNNAVLNRTTTNGNVIWTNLVNATATGNTLPKTSGCGDCAYDSGAISQQQIDSAGGYIEFSPSYGKRLFAGLGNDLSSATDYNNINYAFNFWGGGGGDWDIREGWANYRASGTFVAGDVFRISVENGVVKYYKNGQLVYTSQVTPTYPLVLDTCLVSLYAAVNNAVISGSSPGIKTDLGLYPEPALPALPAAGGKFIDPTFGTEIMRVTDSSDGVSNGTFYSYWPTFNSNNTRILVRRDGDNADATYVFNPSTFTLGTATLLPRLQDNDTFNAQSATWSATDPNVLYCIGTNLPKLWAVNVSTGSSTLIRDFTGQPGVAANDHFFQMSMSVNADVFAFLHVSLTNGNVGYIVYRRSSNQVVLNEPNTVNGHTINEVQLDKGGRYLGIPLDPPPGNWSDTDYSYYLRDLLATPPTMQGLTYHSQDNANGHSDFGTGTLINVENLNNRILIRSLATPHQQSLVLQKLDWTQGTHVSMLANDEAWVLVGFYNEYSTTPRQGVFHNELLLVKTDSNQSVRRFAHHRSVFDASAPQNGLGNYWNTPRANISKDGRFVAFTSNWGGTNRQDMFVARLY